MEIKNRYATLLVVLISMLTISSEFGSCYSNVSSLKVFGSGNYEDNFTDATKWNCFGNVIIDEVYDWLILLPVVNPRSGYAEYNGLITAPVGEFYKVIVECVGICDENYGRWQSYYSCV